MDYRHVLLKITHVQVTYLAELLKQFEAQFLNVTRDSKTLSELLQPDQKLSHQSLSHAQKLDFRQLQDVFERDMPNAVRILTLVKELPFKDAY